MKNSNFIKVIKMITKSFNCYHYYKKSIITIWEHLACSQTFTCWITGLFGNTLHYERGLPRDAAWHGRNERILTPSNSPYLGGESISFCRSQFPSPSIGGRVRVGGSGELRKIIFTQAVLGIHCITKEDFRNEQ